MDDVSSHVIYQLLNLFTIKGLISLIWCRAKCTHPIRLGFYVD